MVEQRLVSMVQHLGYALTPDPHPYAPDHHTLLIAMREIPTELHF